MRNSVNGVFTGNLILNPLGTFSTSVASGLQDELQLVGLVASAGETSRDASGAVRTRRMRPRFGVNGNIVDPNTGEVITVGVSTAVDFNMRVSDETKGKAYLRETMLASQQRWANMTPATIDAFVDAIYDLSKNYGGTAEADAADSALKALWASNI